MLNATGSVQLRWNVTLQLMSDSVWFRQVVVRRTIVSDQKMYFLLVLFIFCVFLYFCVFYIFVQNF
jgi:hypothetical protein